MKLAAKTKSMTEVHLGQMAEAQARRAKDVKDFGERRSKDHTTAYEGLTVLANKMERRSRRPSGTIRPSRISPPERRRLRSRFSRGRSAIPQNRPCHVQKRSRKRKRPEHQGVGRVHDSYARRPPEDRGGSGKAARRQVTAAMQYPDCQAA